MGSEDTMVVLRREKGEEDEPRLVLTIDLCLVSHKMSKSKGILGKDLK